MKFPNSFVFYGISFSVQAFCVSHAPQFSIIVPNYTNEIPILDDDDDE